MFISVFITTVKSLCYGFKRMYKSFGTRFVIACQARETLLENKPNLNVILNSNLSTLSVSGSHT